MKIDGDIPVFEDRDGSGGWRVEYFDDDGGCYVTIFAGLDAERRARDYRNALQTATLKPVPEMLNLAFADFAPLRSCQPE